MKENMLDTPLTRADVEFLEKVDESIMSFVKADEQMLEFDPMNGYQRRLVHKLGTLYNLTSQSVGEQDDRFVCLIKNDQTRIPENKPKLTVTEEKRPRFNDRNNRYDKNRGQSQTFDMGNESYFTKPGTRIVLRDDGSFGFPFKEERRSIIDDRIVEEGWFQILKNRIVCPSDEN